MEGDVIRMKDFCAVIGEFLVTALLFAVPILCTCSIILNWDWHISSLLVILSAADYALLWGFISDNID
jgi:RsiW-degrading membrane proteinase PrsW (M82 family)